jgi:high-affinity iron transporter
MAEALISFPVITIFAREFLEGSVIIGEYRTIILRGDSLHPTYSKDSALRDVTLASLFATALALLVIAAVAIALAVLSMNFDNTTAKIIEGVSKIVAGISLLQLSLKLPKFLGVYGSCKSSKNQESQQPSSDGAQDGNQNASGDSESVGNQLDYLTKRSIRFNVAWNIWREVAECGVFLIPFFLAGDLRAIPLSAVIGAAVGTAAGFGIYFANKRLKNKKGLAIFAVLLLCLLSSGLLTGGCHNLEVVFGATPTVWTLQGDFWSIDRLPMTLLKPFGYNDSRTVLEIVVYWSWLGLSALLHYRKYRMSPKPDRDGLEGIEGDSSSQHSKSMIDTLVQADSSLEGDLARDEASSVDGAPLRREASADDTAIDEEQGLGVLEGQMIDCSSQGAPPSLPSKYKFIKEAVEL